MPRAATVTQSSWERLRAHGSRARQPWLWFASICS